MVLFRSRYLVLEIVSLGHTLDDSLLTTAVLSNAIHDSLLTNFGEHGLASSLPSLQGERFCYKRSLCACVCGLGFSRVGEQQGYGNLCVCGGFMAVKYVNGATGLCVVRCSREQYRTIWASITFITHLHNVPVLFNLLNLSGKAPCSCCCCCRCRRHLTSVIMMIALLEASRNL
jgi:ribonuclease P/MRP protein subunit POP5